MAVLGVGMVVALTATAGCSSDGPRIVNVSGVVTVDGEPAEAIRVVFTPVAGDEITAAGPGSRGVTDASGRFVLQTAAGPPRVGAVVGEHSVTLGGFEKWDPDSVAAAEAEGRPVPRFSFAKKQATYGFTVPAGGTTSADFEVEDATIVEGRSAVR